MVSVGTDIAEYLKLCHKTEAEAIKGRNLRELFGLQDKQLRSEIALLRQEGEAICSSSNGYWYSKDLGDLEKTLHRLEAQVHNMENSIAGLQRILQEARDEEEVQIKP